MKNIRPVVGSVALAAMLTACGGGGSSNGSVGSESNSSVSSSSSSSIESILTQDDLKSVVLSVYGNVDDANISLVDNYTRSASGVSGQYACNDNGCTLYTLYTLYTLDDVNASGFNESPVVNLFGISKVVSIGDGNSSDDAYNIVYGASQEVNLPGFTSRKDLGSFFDGEFKSATLSIMGPVSELECLETKAGNLPVVDVNGSNYTIDVSSVNVGENYISCIGRNSAGDNLLINAIKVTKLDANDATGLEAKLDSYSTISKYTGSSMPAIENTCEYDVDVVEDNGFSLVNNIYKNGDVTPVKTSGNNTVSYTPASYPAGTSSYYGECQLESDGSVVAQDQTAKRNVVLTTYVAPVVSSSSSSVSGGPGGE